MTNALVLVTSRFAARAKSPPVNIRPASFEVACGDKVRACAIVDEGAEDLLRARRRRQGNLFEEVERLNRRERTLRGEVERLKNAPGARTRRGGGIVVVLRAPEIHRALTSAQRELDELDVRRAALWHEIREIGLALAPWEEEHRRINAVFLRQIDHLIAQSAHAPPMQGRRRNDFVPVPYVVTT